MLRRIDRVILRVPNLPSAVAYYRDVLGLKLLRLEDRVASFNLGEGELILHADPDLPYEETYFLVDDVRDLYRRRQELKLIFVQAPQQVSRGYKAAVKDPFGTVLRLLDRTASNPSAIEDGKSPGSLFAGEEAQVTARPDALIRAYEEVGLTADDLPYTPHFEKLYALYAPPAQDPRPTRRQTWRHLLNLRKSGKLPKLGEARSAPPEVDAESLQTLRRLIGNGMGRRDRLPYTAEFDRMVDEFNKSQKRPLSPHLVWRLVARLAK